VPVEGPSSVPIISVKVSTPILFVFDEDGTFMKGHLYEENSLAMDGIVRALDGFCHIGIGLSAYQAKTEYAKAPANQKARALAAIFLSNIELPLESASDPQIRQQRQKLRETASSIRNLVPQSGLTSDVAAFVKSILPVYEDFMAIMDSAKDDAWIDFVHACKSGAGAQVSPLLIKGPKDRNLVFDNAFQVGGFEAGNLDIAIQRKFYRLESAEWKGRLSVGERGGQWRFDSREGKCELKGVQ
jgi:hypothetical protein